MEPNKKKAVVVSTQYWESPFQVTSHHFARYLVSIGYEVAYISAPVTILHIFKIFEHGFKQRFKNWFKGGLKHENGKLWAYVPFSIIAPDNRPILRSKSLFFNWYKLSIPNLISKLRANSFQNPDLLFLDTIYQPFLLRKLNAKKSVFRVADDFRGFKGWHKSMQKIVNHLGSQADLCIYPSQSLQLYTESLSPKKKLLIPNGVDSSFFSDIKIETNPLHNIPSPIVIYIGAIKEWFDFELLEKCLLNLTEVSFVLIGDKAKNVKELLNKYDNLYHLGNINHNQIKQYLLNSDVGIIPFNSKDFPRLVNPLVPLKLYEYLACGLNVVATSWDEIELQKPPIFVSSSKDDFCKNIVLSIDQPINEKQLINYARNFMLENIYNKLMGRIDET
jgi:hypothetical protein